MFKWIAAGSGFCDFGGIEVYCRFRKRKGEFEEKTTYNGTFIKLKDRELFVTRQGWKEYNIPIVKQGWDYCIDTNMLGIDSATSHEGLMYCYEPQQSKIGYSYDKSKSETPIFGDSGGYKLCVGTLDFIDPHLLAKWYNKYVTRGMTLDIPPNVYCSDEVMKQCAKVQHRNTQVLKEELDDNVILYNVLHGFNEKTRKEYLEVVQDDDLKHYAIGSTYYGNTLDFVYNCVMSMDMLPGCTYHIFGIAGIKIIPILAWLGRYYDFTSDSSSHLQSGRCSTIFTMQGYYLKKLMLGYSRPDILQTKDVSPYLTCSCNICNVLGTSELYYKGSSNIVSRLLPLHNINCLSRYVQMWSDLAKTDLDTYKKALCKIIPQGERIYNIGAIDFIEYAQEHGVEKAYNKWKMMMLLPYNSISSALTRTTLIEEDIDMTDYSVSVKSIIDRYKKFYKGEKFEVKGKTHSKIKNSMGISTSKGKKK